MDKHGVTDHCPGCLSIVISGRANVAHSDECRTRIESMMRSDPVGRVRLEADAQRKRAHQAQEGQGAENEDVRAPAEDEVEEEVSQEQELEDGPLQRRDYSELQPPPERGQKREGEDGSPGSCCKAARAAPPDAEARSRGPRGGAGPSSGG